ncbi:hypothetical protein PQR12_07615 [Paraburkholderia nemoris]|uniref:hypothetical protein n=1 Tax=Paraburkholderia nemoris TaxID=2793076 RepID=UPI0038BDCFDE
MINATAEKLVFLKKGRALNQAVRVALDEAASTMLRGYGLEDVNLHVVSTKTHYEAGFAKIVYLSALQKPQSAFDEAYVQNAFEIVMGKWNVVTEAQFYRLALSSPESDIGFKRTYAKKFKLGASLFLLSLQKHKAIVLPHTFNWPSLRRKDNFKRNEIGAAVCSELLAFLRTLDSQSEILPHPAFSAVANDRKGREHFLSYGTKLLLASGWHLPGDANVEDLLALKDAEPRGGLPEGFPIRVFIDVMSKRFGDEFPISITGWVDAISSAERKIQTRSQRASSQFTGPKLSNHEVILNGKAKQLFSGRNDLHLIDELLSLEPRIATPKVLERRAALPGLELDFSALAKVWVELELLFLRKARYEAMSGFPRSLAFLNIYLFFYLPYWFKENEYSNLTYPSSPELLTPAVYVSRMLALDGPAPITFIAMLEAVREKRDWNNNYYYSTLQGIEKFFDFIEQNSDELPGCDGFSQPLSSYDYPRITHSARTNKPAIPARVFTVFVQYVEALRVHVSSFIDSVLSGEVDDIGLAHYVFSQEVLDTAEMARIFGGCIPVIFVNGRTVPLYYIPNCFTVKKLKVKFAARADGYRVMELPEPHALNQILVSLYTGLRQNHIQWLDVEKFDSFVDDELESFPLLYVNTDKTKSGAWTPHVNRQVIEILRCQRAWRNEIAEPSYQHRQFYNDNPNTKWPKILPLFSSGVKGAPHPDKRYETVWRRIVGGVQGILPELEFTGLRKLCSLNPPGIGFNSFDLNERRAVYGKECLDAHRKVCDLELVTNITPHSARVSVVSQYISFIPAELIGQYITGQTPAVVYHYVCIEPEYLERQRVHQAMTARGELMRSLDDTSASAVLGLPALIQADTKTSRLGQSLRSDLNATIISFGCISLSISEEGRNGIDVLRETRAFNAAENKTEICPYGNYCPLEIVKRWRGIRRCGLCEYAVRSIDHLQAVMAKIHAMEEELYALTEKISVAMNDGPSSYSDAELDQFEADRLFLGEELAGWKVNAEVLESVRERIKAGADTRRWVTQQPEIIARDLKRVAMPSNLTAYTLLRLNECVAYPTLQNPEMRARFDVLRRSLLARRGRMDEAFLLRPVSNPAAECAGLIKTLVEANSLKLQELEEIIEGTVGGAVLQNEVMPDSLLGAQHG